MKNVFKSNKKLYSVSMNMGTWEKEGYELYDGATVKAINIGFGKALKELENNVKEFEINEENKRYDIFFDIIDIDTDEVVYRKVINKNEGSKIEDFDADSIENKAKFIKEHKKVFNMDYILLKKTSFVTEDMFELWDETGSFGFSDPDKFLSDIIYAMLKASR